MNQLSQTRSGMEGAAWRRFAGVIGTLAVLFSGVAIPYSYRFHLGVGTAAGIYCSFVLMLALALLPGLEAGRVMLTRSQGRWRAASFFFLLCIPYILYALGTGDFQVSALLKVIGVAILPFLVYLILPPRELRRFEWGDLWVGSFLIAVVLGGWLRGIWRVPVNLDFMGRLLLIAVASITWTSVRPVPELAYRLRFTRKALQAAGLNFFYFAAIAIPAGFLIGFTGWNPRWHGVGSFVLDYLEIFLFIALLEEMFFRGFLQSLLSKSFGSMIGAQVVVSLLFGLFHILHAPFPNWRYVALASVAGWFYGEAYRRGGTLLASALTHAMVDTVWRTWFSRA